MKTRYKSSASDAAAIVSGVTVIAFLVALNVSIGAWATQYVVAFWTHVIKGVAIHIPYLPAAVAGLFLGEVVIPAAVGTWVLSFIL